MSHPHRHQVVVVGGGYVGALAAVRTAGRAHRRADVTLVEPRRELVQRLRMHQLAAGQDVGGYDVDKLIGRRVRHVRATADEIDLDRSVVRVSGGTGRRELPFDQVILALGSMIDADAVPGAREHAHSLQDPAAAARLNARLRHLPEEATVAVCGAGLTGIEAASEFAAARCDLRVQLLAAERLGEWLSPAGREELALRLARLGVEVVEGARVVAVHPRRLALADGRELPVDATVWCTGFIGHPLAWNSGLPTDNRGCLLIDATLRCVSHPQVLGAGDAAAIPTLPNGGAFRMSCQAGLPAGAHAADSAVAVVQGREPRPFDFGYLHQGMSLGRRDGLVQWVDRADRPKNSVLTGRLAALYKELVTRSAVLSIRWERRVPGTMRWLSGGAPVAQAMEAASADGAVGRAAPPFGLVEHRQTASRPPRWTA